ncbi:MAG TPA: phage holin family protein, partial [Dermatophilaceae bacterium]|nr:phage holin family protein [Dermatophilaceae bacterium]
MILGFVVRTIINGVALWVAAWLIDGIEFGTTDTAELVKTVALVALIFGLLNAFVRPILKLVSMPFIILTLGLFVFIVNAAMLMLTSWLAEQFGLAFHVDEFFWDAVLGA